jgi:DNA primase
VDFKAVKQAVSMVQVLDHYGITDRFKRSGDSLSGPCPIHNGTDPTQFRVSISKNCWNCFSECKHGGNVLDFVAKMEKASLVKAARLLVEWFQLDIPSGQPDDDEPPKREPRKSKVSSRAESKTSREPLAKADEIGSNKPLGFTLQNLDMSHAYFAERGLKAETVAEFGLGYCAKGSMSGRIVIPIHNGNAELVAYAGRLPGEPTNDQAKYKLPAGFKKSAELFNLHRAIREPADLPLVLVEGFFDVIMLWQQGYRKTVAVMGSILSPAQEQFIIQHTNTRSTVLLMFDEDDAGRFGREQTMLKLCEQRYVRVFKFAEEGQQPEHLTPEQMQQLIGGAL